ncbi:MAG: T9SS type A sorting domain-containing protein, partial [candidate division WOR-3 bacterium]
DNYAYVADGYLGLRIIDISTPSSPSEVGFCFPPSYAYDVVVSGSYAYVAAGTSGLQMYENIVGGLNERDRDKEKVLKVTQNLFMEAVQVEVHGTALPVTLNIYDVTGRIVEKAVIYNSSPVTVGSDLTPGIYFVGINSFESVKIEKLR